MWAIMELAGIPLDMIDPEQCVVDLRQKLRFALLAKKSLPSDFTTFAFNMEEAGFLERVTF